MVTALAQVAPLREVVRSLLLYVRLTVFTRASGDVLFDGVLDLYVSDLVAKRRQRIGPARHGV
jgi:hypothetical protein